MLIVAGSLHVDPAERDAYLADCIAVIEQARQAPGCVDFHLSADLLDPGRINVFEQWESAAQVEAFRGGGPSDEQAIAIRSASITEHEVASSTPLS